MGKRRFYNEGMEKKSKRAFLYGLLPDGTKASSLEEAMKAWKIAKDGVVYMRDSGDGYPDVWAYDVRSHAQIGNYISVIGKKVTFFGHFDALVDEGTEKGSSFEFDVVSDRLSSVVAVGDVCETVDGRFFKVMSRQDADEVGRLEADGKVRRLYFRLHVGRDESIDDLTVDDLTCYAVKVGGKLTFKQEIDYAPDSLY